MSKTKKILKRFSLLREYKVVSDLKVSVNGKDHQFDQLLVGTFGILCLRIFLKKGELYGNEQDEEFILLNANKTKREKTENLVKKAQDDEAALREILSKNKIYQVKIDKAVVVENKFCSAMISSDSVAIYSLSELKKQLNCGKYDMDYKLDVNKIVDAIINSK